MADKRFEYVVSVTVVDATDERARRHCEIRGAIEAPVEEDPAAFAEEACRRAVSEASEKCHAGRLMGGVADGGE